MKIIEVQQGSAAWLAIRAQYPCASEAPVVMNASRHMTRGEFMRLKATGGEQEFSDYVKQRVLARGHASEASARMFTQEDLGEELFPVTVVSDNPALPFELLASLDGITIDDSTIYEHKEWNEELAGQVLAQQLEPHYYWQLEQQLAATGAEKVLFVCSDGTREKRVSMYYTAVPGRLQQLLAGWKQFQEDLANYRHVEVPPPATGAVIEALPALLVQIEGKVVASNLEAFESKAAAFIAAINTELTTDQHFADAAETVKFCKDGEERLELVKAQAIAQTASIEKLFATIDKISAQLRAKRLELDKLVTVRKETVRANIVREGQVAFAEHITSLNTQLGKPYMPAIATDFAGVVKGKKTVTSMRDAVAAELARAKIEANAIAGRIQVNLNWLRENARDHAALFPDTGTIVLKAHDDLIALAQNRITQHKAAEAQKEADQRERIRKEELARIEREQEAERQAELRRQQQAPEAAKAAPAVAAVAAPAPIAAPAPAASPAPQAPAANSPTVVPLRAASQPSLKLGEINARIAPLSIDAAGLAQLGFPHVSTDRSAKLYHEADFARMLDSMVAHLRTAQAKQRLQSAQAA